MNAQGRWGGAWVNGGQRERQAVSWEEGGRINGSRVQGPRL